MASILKNSHFETVALASNGHFEGFENKDLEKTTYCSSRSELLQNDICVLLSGNFLSSGGDLGKATEFTPFD